MDTIENKTQTCTWTGASGKNYTYYVHDLTFGFNKNQYGNYIYSKINSDNRWVPIYIGEGDLGERVSDDHHKAKCIKSKGATHVHAHKTSGKMAGEAEETDLLVRYTNAYEPTGCNEKIGG